MSLSDERLAEIVKEHEPCCTRHETDGGFCVTCFVMWPCETVLMAQGLIEARQEIREAEAARADWWDEMKEASKRP